MATNSPQGTMPAGQESPSQDPQPSGQDIQQNPGQTTKPSKLPANGQQTELKDFKGEEWYWCNPCCCMELERGVRTALICLIVYFVISTLFYMVCFLTGFSFIQNTLGYGDIVNLLCLPLSLLGILSSSVMIIGVIKKSVCILRKGMVVYPVAYSFPCGLNVIFSGMSLSESNYLGLLIAFYIITLVVLFYIQILISVHFQQLKHITLMQDVGQLDGHGQHPSTNQRKLHYQPSVPTVAHSQTSLNPGGDQQPLSQL